MDYAQGLDAFTITFRREVLFYLHQLVNDSELITVVFDDGKEAFLTMLLAIDEAEDLLIFDWGGSEATNQKLLRHPSAYFVANPVGVRNQFLTHRIWETSHKGRPAFATRIPEKFVRLQRREFYRLSLPMTQRINCHLTYGTPPVTRPMSIIDLGLGGIGLEAPPDSTPVSPGLVIPTAIIELGKIGALKTGLEIRHCQTLTRGTKQIDRMGCQFINLSQANENLLQRFITKIQQEERARTG